VKPIGACLSAFESCLGAMRCPGSNLAVREAPEALTGADCEKSLMVALHGVEQLGGGLLKRWRSFDSRNDRRGRGLFIC